MALPPANPLSRASTAERAADMLRARIASGALAPGERLVELEISRELGVSRSPIREALLRLSEEGLVKLLPYRGAIVAPLHRERLLELLEFRLALERFAIEKLIQGGDAGALASLRGHVIEISDAIRSGDMRGAVDADMRTHRAIVDFAGNALLSRAYEGLLNQFQLYIRLTSSHYERVEDLADEHVSLLDAIERGDLVMARRVLDAHILHGLDEALEEAPVDRPSEPTASD